MDLVQSRIPIILRIEHGLSKIHRYNIDVVLSVILNMWILLPAHEIEFTSKVACSPTHLALAIIVTIES